MPCPPAPPPAEALALGPCSGRSLASGLQAPSCLHHASHSKGCGSCGKGCVRGCKCFKVSRVSRNVSRNVATAIAFVASAPSSCRVVALVVGGCRKLSILRRVVIPWEPLGGPAAAPVLLLLPPGASPDDLEAFRAAAAWLAEALALQGGPTPSGLVPGPLPATAPRPRSSPVPALRS